MNISRWFAAALVFLLATPVARADILSLDAGVFGGGAGGAGLAGDQKDNAFHDGAAGGAYGARVGVEFLLIDGWIEHTQYRNSDGLAGTWTQFMIGIDATLPMGQQKGTHPGKDGKPTGGYSGAFLELGLATGFGVGTGQQVEPPLDYAQVTDRGFLVQGQAYLAYRLNRVLSLGVRVPVQYGYMFKKGVANDTSTHYQSVQGAALLDLQFKFKLK